MHAEDSKGDRRPKLNSARKTRSQIKSALKEKHKIDMDDEARYPTEKKSGKKRKWKSYTELLAKEGNLFVSTFVYYSK